MQNLLVKRMREQQLINEIFQDSSRFSDAAAVYNYFRNRSNINYFPVVDAVETSRRRVEEILENRFEFNKETYHLPTDFDWLKNPSDDIEWQILLHKFYYAPGLGEAFRETGDERFLQKWVELLRGWMAVTPPGFIASDVTGPARAELDFFTLVFCVAGIAGKAGTGVLSRLFGVAVSANQLSLRKPHPKTQPSHAGTDGHFYDCYGVSGIP